MPFIFDFKRCFDKPTRVEVNPQGWRNPITVEYGIAQAHPYDTQKSVVWRVVGTTHTFTIYEEKLNLISHANYKQHFEEILTNFRIDYLNWFKREEYKDADWKYEYEAQYSRFILPDNDGDKGSEDKKD